MVRSSRFVAVTLAIVALLLITAQGCSDAPEPAAFGTGNPRKKDAGEGGICLLNNCTLDRDCGDCSEGRTVCSEEERRCVACGPDADGKTCKSGQYCTKYGSCVPNSVTCTEDAEGVPSTACKVDAECAACGPKFRVCNPESGTCVGCLADRTENCQSTDTCRGNNCVPKCPKNCSTDDDCGDCGLAGKGPTACNKHVCAQCSPTKACPGGGRCDFNRGTCLKPCGLGRPGKPNCTDDANCSGCLGATKCKLPINGGEGACVAPATGCSDIGKGIVVLPDPFSRFTNLCSDDRDCANISADLNVGKIIRDVTGIDAIKDGNLKYGMRACSSVDVLDKSCGICVPCRVDTDCVDIDVTKVAGDLFGPLGSVGATILLDQAFGPNDHKIHMFCQNLVNDVGVCLPCPNLLASCAQTSAGLPATGSCDHDVCQLGAPLGLQCSAPCVAQVCANDPYCCSREWDSQCKADVDLYCKDRTCEPDKCIFRPAGWYCFSDATKGGYRCAGEPGQEQIAEGKQCNGSQVCRRQATGPKEPAVLCTAEGDDVPGCPPGSLNKPKCFDP
jgi:hypothetical protein